MGISRGPKITTDGLVLVWDANNHKSYPGTGTTWTDLIKKEAGTLPSEVVYSDNHMTFTNGLITTSTTFSDLATFGNNLTFEVWANSTTAFQFKSFGGVATNSAWTDGFGIFWNSSTTVHFFVNTYNINFAAASGLSTNVWYQFVGVYDGDAGSDNIKLYVNAVQSATTDTLTDNITGLSTNNFEIGAIGGWTDRHSGDMDLLLVYNRSLSLEEIQQNFNAHRGRFGI